MTEQLWWYVARSSGIVSWGLAAASVIWGLLASSRVFGRRLRAKWILDLHRFLGGLTVVFVAVHLGALLLDSYVEFSIADLVVPLASDWHPIAVAWGIVALYLLVAVELSSLAMRRIPRRWWRAIHFSSFALFATGTVHALTAGTDAGVPAFQWAVNGAVGAVVFLTAFRALTSRRVASFVAGYAWRVRNKPRPSPSPHHSTSS